MASVVVWDIVRRESAFLRKSNGIELSSEPLNVTGANSYKFSGLSQVVPTVVLASQLRLKLYC